VPPVAAAFEHFLRIKGQSEILKQIPALRRPVLRKNQPKGKADSTPGVLLRVDSP
jgi:hypothetical protein